MARSPRPQLSPTSRLCSLHHARDLPAGAKTPGNRASTETQRSHMPVRAAAGPANIAAVQFSIVGRRRRIDLVRRV